MAALQRALERILVRDAARSYVKGFGRALCKRHKDSFRWRHRFLELLAHDKQALLESIIEADETYFPDSEQGNRRLVRSPKKRSKSSKESGDAL